MLKRFAKRISLNFRQSRTERAASVSYSNYHQKIKKIFSKATIFNKLKKQ